MIHQQDRAEGYARLELPEALACLNRTAEPECGWRLIFPRRRRWRRAGTGDQGCDAIAEPLFQLAWKAAFALAAHTTRDQPYVPAFIRCAQRTAATNSLACCGCAATRAFAPRWATPTP